MAGRVFGKYAELISKESCQRQAFCALSSEMEAFCELFWTIVCSFWGFFFFHRCLFPIFAPSLPEK